MFNTSTSLNNQNSQNSLLRSFIDKFTSNEFFVNLIRITLYPADFGTIQSNKTIDYIKSFLIDIDKIIKFNKFANKNVQLNIQLINSLLTIRESHSNILTYNNVFQHITIKDLSVTKLIQIAVSNRIESSDEFRKLKDEILNSVQAYYEIYSVSANIILLDNLTNSISSENIPIFEALQNYKTTIINAYNDLSKLQSLNKEETANDYFVLTNKESAKSLAKTLYSYVSTGYSFFKTGYDIFDNNSDGFESSSVHVISAPSNHGKSLFMVNLANTIIQSNLNDFKQNDVVLFLTLEDDIFKLFRRFSSIFGNYQYSSLKRLFKKCYEISKTEHVNNSMKDKIINMFMNVVHSSIIKSTGEKVGLVLKHSNENTFSPGDLGRFIDQLKVEGYNTKLVIVDYIDTMSPTVTRYVNSDDYNSQGQIVQELRSLSRLYKIPIITATQNKRESENVTTSMSNAQVGDSYKKIRFADFVYMARMRRDLSIFTSPVMEHILDSNSIKNGLSPQITAIKDELSEKLIPFEIMVTKAKESDKNFIKFLIMCIDNLKIYNNLQEYLNDINKIKINSNQLNNDIDILSNLFYSAITEENFSTDQNSSMPF